MTHQELFIVLTALVRHRLERAPDSQPSSLRLARERLRHARARASAIDPWRELDALREDRRSPPSRPSRL